MLLPLQYSNDTQVQVLLSYLGSPSPPTVLPPGRTVRYPIHTAQCQCANSRNPTQSYRGS